MQCCTGWLNSMFASSLVYFPLNPSDLLYIVLEARGPISYKPEAHRIVVSSVDTEGTCKEEDVRSASSFR